MKSPDLMNIYTEFEIAEKIENTIIHYTDKKLLIWDFIRSASVKLLIIFSFINLIYRSDFASVYRKYIIINLFINDFLILLFNINILVSNSSFLLPY